MTNLGLVIFLDIEGKIFQTTIDGKTKKSYTFEQVLNCQHLIDNPGYDAAAEAAHFNAKPKSGTDRGAQPFTEAQLHLYITNLKGLKRKHLHLPGQLAKRVMSEMGYEPEDACLAWYHYANTKTKIVDMVRELKPVTGSDRHRHKKLNESREDSCHRIDYLASEKYINQETEDARRILEDADLAGAISNALREEFNIKRLKSGPRKGILTFEETWVMPIYVACCKEGGVYRHDNNGNPIGVRQVLGGILHHHAHKAGKGSKASARAKTRLRLRTSEKRYRAANQIPDDKDFPDPVPTVRKHHQQMNKELVRIFRDYSK